MKTKYKFEEYRDLNFPVYSSLQENKKNLIQPHFHDDMEFVKILSGEISVCAGMQKHICTKGDIILFLPSVVHEMTAQTPDASIRGLVFNTGVLKENIVFSHAYANSYIFTPDHNFYSELNCNFEKAITVYENPSSAYKLEMTATLLTLTATLVKCGIIECTKADSDNIRIQPVIDYIAKNYSRKITTYELADILCVCTDHFIRIFRKITSKTPAEYITDYRISMAMKMLVSDKYSLSEISDMSGFSNPCYFSKIFKQKTGMTPSGYRKNH